MRRAPWLLSAVVLTLASVFATDAGARARLEGIPAEVRGGDRLEIRWSDLDRDVHEVELELSLGGARWVRISPEMEAYEGHFTWRVPERLAGDARIRLRAGEGGGRGERDVAEVSFRLVSASVAVPAAARATPGWWDVGSDEAALPCGVFSRRHASLAPHAENAEAVTVSVSFDDRAASLERANGRPGAAALVARARACSFVAPRQAPLRN